MLLYANNINILLMMRHIELKRTACKLCIMSFGDFLDAKSRCLFSVKTNLSRGLIKKSTSTYELVTSTHELHLCHSFYIIDILLQEYRN